MKAKCYAAIAIALALASAAHAGGAHDHSPKHGGVVAEAKDMDYELVAIVTIAGKPSGTVRFALK